jgi:hypothetical protein
MKSKLLFLILGIFLLVSLIPGVMAIDNFNISSSISSSPLFFLNGTSGNADFGFNVSASYFSGDGSGLTGLNLTGVSGSSQWTTTGSDISVSDSLFIGNLNISTELNGEVNVW